jgi:ABC-2 type transport system permease protein
VPFAFAFIFLTTSQTFGVQIAQSIIEEKQTRIVEILVAAVPVRALLAGKMLVNRLEDIGGVSMPVQLAVMLPFFAVIFLNDNVTAMRVLSYLPFSAPTAMPLRSFTGDAAGWELVVSLALLLVAALGFLLAGARVYEGSLLRTNGRTSIRTAWRERETLR